MRIEISTEWSFHCGYVLGDARKFLDQVTWKRWICFVKSSSPTCLVFPIFSKSGLIAGLPSDTQKPKRFPKQRCFYPRSLRRLKASWPLELLGFFWVRGTMLLQLGAADMDLKRLWGFKIWWKTDLIWGGLWGGLKLRHTHICGWIAVRIYYKYFRWCCKKEVYIHVGRFWDVLYML